MEDYVTYEQAVKLRKLGFDWEDTHYYEEDAKLTTHKEYISGNGGYEYELSVENFYYSVNTNRLYQNVFDAPTLSQAAKWLREKKNLSIEVIAFGDEVIEERILVKKCFWEVGIMNISKNSSFMMDYLHDRFETYEEALSTGIDAALELIKE